MIVRREQRARALDAIRPDALFDPQWYLSAYPDVAAVTQNGWGHFVAHGEREGRAPGPSFDPEFYRRTHLPLEGEHPFTHYVTQGRLRGHAPRAVAVTAAQSAFAMRAALQGRVNPVLLVGNDARSAGGPLLLLEVARRLRARGRSPVFLLKQGGPLFDRFAALGPTMIADEGWDLAALGAALPVDLPILANTAWGALLVERLGVAERSTVLVHEMPDYLVAQDLLVPVSRARVVVASMPVIEAELARLLAPAPRLETIIPGVRAPTPSKRGERRVRRRLAAEFGPPSRVFLGAGYADERKGFDLFLDAAQKIAAGDRHATFVWLGELSGWARSLADEALSEGLRLALPGFRTDADDWYAATDVYLLTSRQDPGPTTVMNAASVGVPFVGLDADIGLRALADVIAATGEFVADTDALAARAQDVARASSVESRARRASFVRSYQSLDRYVDSLEDVVADGGSADTRIGFAGRLRVHVRLASLRVLHSNVLPRLVHRAGSAALQAIRLVRRRVPVVAAHAAALIKRTLVSVAVVQAPGLRGTLVQPPELVCGDANTIVRLVPGDRIWVENSRLLAVMPEQADLHIVRRAGEPPWPLVRELESSARRIARVTQYDADAPPRWARTGGRPPRPRRGSGVGGVPHPSVTLAPHGSIRLSRSIGVFVHAYYVELAVQIAERLAVIDHPFSLYVSTTDESRAEQIRSLLPAATVRVFPNQGRDIAPKVFGFAPEHAAHDVVLHLHTKRSPHRSDLSGWLSHILDCLLPSPEGVAAILALLTETDRVGMVSPALHPSLGETVQWGPNRAIAEVVTWGKGWPALPESDRLAFAAGSMFWARSSALIPVQQLEVPTSAFSDSPETDGTLAHAVERLIGVSCGVAGYDQVFVNPVAASAGETAASRPLTPAEVERVLRRSRGFRHDGRRNV
ncbi:rhamnan synthesis F family protein [Microbacterium sp. LWO12-1.2]|uniref:rhamnan synthesis F family protein n=1 Tax=Microbacterium sp. LWO12-1.2 TaxID=3135261 RepID=UPI0034232D8F